MGVTPAPHSWADAVAALNRRGAKYVGINSSGGSCVGVVGGSGFSPCYFMHRTAEETGSVDLDGDTLVYDLPSGGASDAVFIDTIVSAIELSVARPSPDN